MMNQVVDAPKAPQQCTRCVVIAMVAALPLFVAACGSSGTDPASAGLPPVASTPPTTRGITSTPTTSVRPVATYPATEPTLWPAPLPAPEGYEPIPQEDMESIRVASEERRTVALESDAAGSPLWWMTTWSGRASTGTEVFCLATSNGGVTCQPDVRVLQEPVQIAGVSMDSPTTLMLLADSTATSLTAAVDGEEPIFLELTPVGVESGLQAAGLYLPGVQAGVEFEATAAGQDFRFYADLAGAGFLERPSSEPVPSQTMPPTNALNEMYAPLLASS